MSQQGFTILVVDDTPAQRQVVRQALLQQRLASRVLEAEDGARALTLLATEKVDLVITDMVMPQLDGRQFIRTVRSMKEFHELPIMVLSTRDNMQERLSALEAGATDYVLHPFHALELAARVRNLLNIKAMQDQLRAYAGRMEQLAITDELTGLANRRRFLELADMELRRTQRYGAPVGLLVADVDHFKKINDELGHLEGDRVLRALGGILRSTLRTTDLVGRYGGEEFTALLPMTDLAGTVTTAERLLHAVGATLRAEDRVVTISIGVTHVPTHGPAGSFEDLFARADGQLYQAKQQGRNRVVVGPTPA